MLDTLGAIVGPTSALWLLGAFDWRSASGRDPAFLNAFLADPMSEIGNTVSTRHHAVDRHTMAVCAQDFCALKSLINPAFGGTSN
jgi:hypothetical protein